MIILVSCHQIGGDCEVVLFVSRLFLSSFVVYFVAWCSFYFCIYCVSFCDFVECLWNSFNSVFVVLVFVICWVFVTFWFMFVWVGVSSFIHEKRDREISSPNSHCFCWTDDLPLQLLKLKNLNICRRKERDREQLKRELFHSTLDDRETTAYL